MDDQAIKRNTLAADVLRLSRNTLLVNLRFLDAALHQLTPYPLEDTTLATEGNWLLYDPAHVLRCYKSAREIPVRDYLHVILHCVFRHMYVHTLVDRECWDLACDIAVEYTVTELGLKATAAFREREQHAEFDRLKQAAGQMTAEKLYRYFLDAGLSRAKMADLRGLFYADDHAPWYMSDGELRAMGVPHAGLGAGEGEPDDEGREDGSGSGAPQYGEARWEELSNRMQMEMENFAKQQGDKAGNLMQNLREVNRERYDYTAFLRKFAVMGEAMRVNDDEFDQIFYTYGMKLYKKMPLIEPLEYKEVKRIREFVIAIDTSGSVAGEQVQRFLQKTYNILQSTESFFSRINVHILQCDATIQEDAKITGREEFDAYLKTMKLRGLGGTDFRPVFSYVDWLREKKEFQNLKGLIYFTDGWGTFPEKKPDYETAFVFVDDGMNNYNVPPWAIKLVLQKEEI